MMAVPLTLSLFELAGCEAVADGKYIRSASRRFRGPVYRNDPDRLIDS